MKISIKTTTRLVITGALAFGMLTATGCAQKVSQEEYNALNQLMDDNDAAQQRIDDLNSQIDQANRELQSQKDRKAKNEADLATLKVRIDSANGGAK